jgi:hypothetical protein
MENVNAWQKCKNKWKEDVFRLKKGEEKNNNKYRKEKRNYSQFVKYLNKSRRGEPEETKDDSINIS